MTTQIDTTSLNVRCLFCSHHEIHNTGPIGDIECKKDRAKVRQTINYTPVSLRKTVDKTEHVSDSRRFSPADIIDDCGCFERADYGTSSL